MHNWVGNLKPGIRCYRKRIRFQAEETPIVKGQDIIIFSNLETLQTPKVDRTQRRTRTAENLLPGNGFGGSKLTEP